VEDGSVNRIFNAPRKGYTQSLLAASFMLPADQQDNRPPGPIGRKS
jgi:ABC-type dipeptide/oligopeptide/nickel transport system ATPase component